MKTNLRKQVIRSAIIAIAMIVLILVIGCLATPDKLHSSAAMKSMKPSLSYPFGTDWMGRNMLFRVAKGLQFSLGVGLLGALLGVGIAIVLGMIAALGNKMANDIVMWVIDLFIGMPHLIFMILISFAVGKGAKGVVVATALTHWPSLARLIRNEVVHIKQMEYVALSRNLGKNNFFIAKKHVIPVLIPQIIVGFLLLFPHVIIHEASMTFLGFGLSAQTPSIGIILSEAIKHITLGDWWLAVFPGLALLVLVKSFDSIGESIRISTNPNMRYQ